MGVISIEDRLKERIKELTCLYNVSSLIRDSDFSNIEKTLKGISVNVKDSIRFPDAAFVEIQTKDYYIAKGNQNSEAIFILSAIKVFLPTIIQSHLFLNRWTRNLEYSSDIHCECPVEVAIFPSRVIAVL